MPVQCKPIVEAEPGSPKRRQTMFKAYLQQLRSSDLRPEQKSTRTKSYAEAHMRDIAASKIIAFMIWEVGMPELALAAEQRDSYSQQGALAAEQHDETLEANTIAIVEWLDAAAQCFIAYRKIRTPPGGAAQSWHPTPCLWYHVRRASTKGQFAKCTILNATRAAIGRTLSPAHYDFLHYDVVRLGCA